jgi:hypothetical protein
MKPLLWIAAVIAALILVWQLLFRGWKTRPPPSLTVCK